VTAPDCAVFNRFDDYLTVSWRRSVSADQILLAMCPLGGLSADPRVTGTGAATRDALAAQPGLPGGCRDRRKVATKPMRQRFPGLIVAWPEKWDAEVDGRVEVTCGG